MKTLIKLTAVSLLSSLALHTHAADSANLYGELNASFQREISDDDGADVTKFTDSYHDWRLESNASHFGLKGALDMDEGLTGLYQFEFEIAVDDGNARQTGQTLVQRDIFVGLQDERLGKLIAGEFDTPFRRAQGNIDLFDDYRWADIRNVLSNETRAGNIVQYSTPNLGNMAFNLAIIPGEETGKSPNLNNDGPADGYSASALYETEGAFLALAIDSDVVDGRTPPPGVSGNTAIQKKALRLAGQFHTTDSLTLGAIVQTSENVGESVDGKADLHGLVLSAAYVSGTNTYKFQGGTSTIDVGLADDLKLTSWSVGIDHALRRKDAKVFAYYTQWSQDNNLGTTAGLPATKRTDRSTFGVGVEQRFNIGL